MDWPSGPTLPYAYHHIGPAQFIQYIQPSVGNDNPKRSNARVVRESDLIVLLMACMLQ